MSANPNQLALRYLLQLSADIRSAIVLSADGALIASAPAEPGDHLRQMAADLLRATLELRNGSGESVELDALCGGEAVYVLSDGRTGMVCVAHRLALPGIVLHEMRSVFGQLEVSAAGEAATG